jgi:hypothetical protein
VDTAAHSRGGNRYVVSVSTTEAGFGIESAPFVAIPLDADDAEVGPALRAALDASRSPIPTRSGVKVS